MISSPASRTALTRFACIISLISTLAVLTGCGAHAVVLHDGVAQSGRRFYITEEWDSVGRINSARKTQVTWYNMDPNSQAPTGCAVIKNGALEPFTVRSEKDRIWLVANDRDRVIGAIDFENGEAFTASTILPFWADAALGSQVQDRRQQ